MRLKDLLKSHYTPDGKFVGKTENDMTSDMKKVLMGSHISTLGLDCTSSEDQLKKGLLLFKDKKTTYKIDIEGKYFKGTEEIGKVKKSSDTHSQYSNALHELIKWIKDNK